MMDNHNNMLYAVVVILSLLVAFLAGSSIGNAINIGKLKATAIQTECARYHPNTAKFEWLKEQE
jgi:TRAP-type C4-dicarboxylate transport system permease large subunit